MEDDVKQMRVKSVKHLKQLSGAEGGEFVIALKGCVSVKRIRWDGEMFEIENEIDGTVQRLTEEELFRKSETNIGMELAKGNLYYRMGYE